MQNIIVTGGAGYIGSHVCKALYERGFTPITIDNLSTGHKSSVKYGPFIHGDISDRKLVQSVISNYSPLAVMHFAAFSCVGESVENPSKYYQNNISGTLALLESMLECDLKNIVFSSTCSIFGIPECIPISENSPKNPINPYGLSKLAVENMLNDFDNAYGIKSASLRYFNAAGADESAEIGEMHDPETHLIPLVLQAASGQRDGITIFGNDYNTKDGTCIRDYIHVTDLAEAHILALRKLFDYRTSFQINLGSGEGYSVNEVIDTAELLTGLKIKRIIGERRAGDPPILTANNKFAKEFLHWTPTRDLEKQIATAWAWHKKAFAPEIELA